MLLWCTSVSTSAVLLFAPVSLGQAGRFQDQESSIGIGEAIKRDQSNMLWKGIFSILVGAFALFRGLLGSIIVLHGGLAFRSVDGAASRHAVPDVQQLLAPCIADLVD